MSNTIVFVKNATADDDYPADPGYVVWPSGVYTIDVDGTYDGATVTIKATQPGGTMKALDGGVFNGSTTAPGNITLGSPMHVAATVSGAGAGTDLTIIAFPMPK